MGNRGDATSMAADGLSGKSASSRGPTSKSSAPKSDPAKDAVVSFSFDSAAETPAGQPTTTAAETPKAATAAVPSVAKTETGESSSGSESDTEGTTKAVGRKGL